MHEHEPDSDTAEGSMSKTHLIIMAICCILPMVLLIVVFAVFPGSPYLTFLIVLLCPLSMVMMQLPRLFSRKKKTGETQPQSETEKGCH